MADNTAIEWADATWNPITGCSVVSPGCTNCYAMRFAGTRLQHHWSRKGLTQDTKAGPVWTGEVRFNEEWLDQPLRWKRPRRIFVCAHGDLFHENVPDEWIDRVFAVMALCPQHVFIVLTKRAERMRRHCENKFGGWPGRVFPHWARLAVERWGAGFKAPQPLEFPLPNVWLGVSVEDQPRADERIPLLLDTPAAKRFISAEPLLAPIDLARVCILAKRPGSPRAGTHIDALRGRYCESGVVYTGAWDIAGAAPPDTERRRLDWVIVGGESGPGARPMDIDWLRSIKSQCAEAGVPCFVKQLGAAPMLHGFTGMPIRDRKGGDWSEWPQDIRVREFP